jgi:cyanophycinase-like exopeptidase
LAAVADAADVVEEDPAAVVDEPEELEVVEVAAVVVVDELDELEHAVRANAAATTRVPAVHLRAVIAAPIVVARVLPAPTSRTPAADRQRRRYRSDPSPFGISGEGRNRSPGPQPATDTTGAVRRTAPIDPS